MRYNYSTFRFTDKSFQIIHKKEIYTKTSSGKSWSKKAIEKTVENCSAEFYTNYVTSIPFFNNMWHGAYCRAEWGYSVAGYLPQKIITVCPGQDKKHIDYFEFLQEEKINV